MNEESDKEIQSEAPTGSELRERSARRLAPLIVVAVVAVLAVGAVAAWFLWPARVGKPVPAPRSVSFEQASPAPASGEQRLVLTPEQAAEAVRKYLPLAPLSVAAAGDFKKAGVTK